MHLPALLHCEQGETEQSMVTALNLMATRIADHGKIHALLQNLQLFKQLKCLSDLRDEHVLNTHKKISGWKWPKHSCQKVHWGKASVLVGLFTIPCTRSIKIELSTWSVARLSRTIGKITGLLKSFTNISTHNNQICLRLSTIVTHMLWITLG